MLVDGEIPFGERVISSSTGNTYKFQAKERDTETTNDDFGARFYASRYARFLSVDWSALPVAVPCANLAKLKWRLREDRFLVKKLPSKILPGRPEPISSIGTRMVISWLEKQKMDLQRP